MGSESSVIPLSGPRSSDAVRNAPPPIFLPVNIPLQSYLDSQFEAYAPTPAAALAEQALNLGIVDTATTPSRMYQQPGFAVGLAPWSECPIAVRFRKPDSGALPLRPGQILIPYPNGFSAGFDYGCPFGWLGGGQSDLYVFGSKDALPDWGGEQKEVLFHRLQTVVRSTLITQPVGALRHNWPTRFPWDFAYRGIAAGTKAVSQVGKPILQVTPTRTLMRLNGAIVQAAGLYSRVVFWGTDDFDTNAAGVVSPTGNFFYDFFWPPNVGPGGMVANDPVVELPAAFAAQAANTYGITIDVPAGSALIGATVDILRYGTIGG